MDYAAMGQRVRQRRQSLGLKQGEVAASVGVTTSFIGQIERGEKKASAETIVALCERLDVSADWLLMGRENRCDQQNCVLFQELVELALRHGRIVPKDSSFRVEFARKNG